MLTTFHLIEKKLGHISYYLGSFFDRFLTQKNTYIEKISDKIISSCHQCGSACDQHVNCNNDACHLLFLQCEKCRIKFDGCCSSD